MKYYHDEDKNHHWFISHNDNCPALMVDMSGDEPQINFMGKLMGLSPQDLTDFSTLLFQMIASFLQTLPAQDLEKIMKEYANTGLAQIAVFKSLIHGRQHITGD